MIKIFCDKCEALMPRSDLDSNSIAGFIKFGGQDHQIWVQASLNDDEHICKNCQFDAIRALDGRYRYETDSKHRPKVLFKDLIRIDEEDEAAEEDIFADVYTPPPLQKPLPKNRPAPTGLKGNVE